MTIGSRIRWFLAGVACTLLVILSLKSWGYLFLEWSF